MKKDEMVPFDPSSKDLQSDERVIHTLKFFNKEKESFLQAS